MSRTLDVYFHGILCGQLTQSDDGQLTFAYTDDYRSENLPAISVAMPLTEKSYTHQVAYAFFSGLLPDERARANLATALGLSRGNAFGLLEIIGGECAGALSTLPAGTEPPSHSDTEPQVLDEKTLSEVLGKLRQRPLLGGEYGVRLSLAGAQDKLAVCLLEGQIALAKDGRPTTHILKPFIEGLNGTVENEWFCMTLAARVGLTAPVVIQGQAKEVRYLLIERYDRKLTRNGSIQREHQEDFCQALSVPPELKYETEGGPGIAQLNTAIRQFTRRPAAELLQLQRMLIFHYLIGNADAHAKNYALLYSQSVPDLAPVYDALSTAVYPRLSKHMAMKVGGRSLPDTIHRTHWFNMIAETKPAQRVLVKEINTMATRIEEESAVLLEEARSSGVYHAVLKDICDGIKKRASLLLRV